jgi:hypothetical protein
MALIATRKTEVPDAEGTGSLIFLIKVSSFTSPNPDDIMPISNPPNKLVAFIILPSTTFPSAALTPVQRGSFGKHSFPFNKN